MKKLSAPESHVSKNRNMTCSSKIYLQGLVYISETKVHQNHLSRGKIVKFVAENSTGQHINILPIVVNLGFGVKNY